MSLFGDFVRMMLGPGMSAPLAPARLLSRLSELPVLSISTSSVSLVQVIISQRPSQCSTSAVHDSTQSPSFMYITPLISLISA